MMFVIYMHTYTYMLFWYVHIIRKGSYSHDVVPRILAASLGSLRTS